MAKHFFLLFLSCSSRQRAREIRPLPPFYFFTTAVKSLNALSFSASGMGSFSGGVRFGASLVKYGSKFAVSSADAMVGMKGGLSSRFSSLAKSTDSNHGCAWISLPSSGPLPRRVTGSLHRSFARRSCGGEE